MVKCFSKKYGNKGNYNCNSKVMSRCLSTPDATSLYHCLKNWSRVARPYFFLHAEGKLGSSQLTLSRLFRFPEIIGGVSGSAI